MCSSWACIALHTVNLVECHNDFKLNTPACCPTNTSLIGHALSIISCLHSKACDACEGHKDLCLQLRCHHKIRKLRLQVLFINPRTLEEWSPGSHDVRHGLLHALSPSALSDQWELWDRAAMVTDFSNNVMCASFQATSGQVCVFMSG